jgi:hypothetical protein
VEYSTPEDNLVSPVVALLIVNDLGILPNIVIKSILRATSSPVIVGYVNEFDVKNLPKDQRIQLINLNDSFLDLDLKIRDRKYESWDDDSFFSLVQLKWHLLKTVLRKFPNRHLIYSDIDVLWIKDATSFVNDCLSTFKKVDFMIQNYTTNPMQPRLCMGFLALRNSPSSLEVIDKCSLLHRDMLATNPRTGDDDVITAYFNSSDEPEKFLHLPQSTFPVGNLANLYSRRMLYPGLIPEAPFIFHANHVVGIQRKIELIYVFSRQQVNSSPLFSSGKRVFLALWISLRFVNYYARKSLRLFKISSLKSRISKILS